MKLRLLAACALLAAGVPMASSAASGADILKSQCIACHSVTKPEGRTVEQLLERKAPDLYYAGVKFNKDWLVAWLQKPTVIRPAGPMYTRAVKAGSGGSPDTIDPAALHPHPKLGAEDAAAVAAALMELGVKDGLVQKGAFKNDPPGGMAALLFNKLRGCAACHSAKPGTGGLSAPELYTAGTRLQPDYIVEYIGNPQKFDPKVWMPHLTLTNADVQKLAAYLTTLKEGAPQ